jgi:2-hydroxychromene-2-carboxylate isomerase
MNDARTVEYWFSFISLYAYIGSRAFQELVARRQLRVVYKPMDLLAVFAQTGGLPVKERTIPRRAYRILEMKRWRELRGIPLVLHPKHYPADPARGHRMLLAALRDGRDVGRFLHNALSAVWAEERNVEDPDTLVALADAAGLDGRALLAASDDPTLRAEAEALTREAIRRKVFGSPFFFWQGEAFWGQDRLDMLEAAITSGRAPLPFGEV